MYKIFYNNRFIAITSRYEDCSSALNSVTYMMQSLEDIQSIIEQFMANSELNKLYVCTGDISEDKVFKKVYSRFKVIVAGGGLVRNPTEEVLMIYRFGYWDLPKGKQEKKESIEETAVREVEEECSIQGLKLIKPITKTYHLYEHKGSTILKESHWFELFCNDKSVPKPQLEEGIEDAKWIKVDELQTYLDKAYPSIKEVFKAYGLY